MHVTIINTIIYKLLCRSYSLAYNVSMLKLWIKNRHAYFIYESDIVKLLFIVHLSIHHVSNFSCHYISHVYRLTPPWIEPYWAMRTKASHYWVLRAMLQCLRWNAFTNSCSYVLSLTDSNLKDIWTSIKTRQAFCLSYKGIKERWKKSNPKP